MNELTRFIIFIGPISSIFDYTTFAMMWWLFGANDLATASRCFRPAGSWNRC